MKFKSKYALISIVKSLERIEHLLDIIKRNPDDFNELDNFLINRKLFARFDYLRQFKEALKHLIGQNC